MHTKLKDAFCVFDQIPEQYRIKEKVQGTGYLINGELKNYSARTVRVITPLLVSEGGPAVIGEYPLLPADEAILALRAAQKAYDNGMGAWPNSTIKERVACMEAFLQRIKPKQEAFAILEMWEIGKKLNECQEEFARTIKYIEDTVNALKRQEEESSRIVRVEGVLTQIRQSPIGVVLCMGPFNYPLNETFAMLIPALMMGNTVVLKPPDPGALCTLPLLEDFASSFPPGVINIINGDGREIIDPLMQDGSVSILAFIGSSRVANILIAQHPHNNRLRTILGLEAKNSAFILPDADLQMTVKECIHGALEFNGQRCTAIKQIWVHEDIKERFLTIMDDSLRKIGFGMPWEKECLITPLAESHKADYLNELLEDACQKGARIVNQNGGAFWCSLYYPALLYPVKPDMRLYHEEQFGPLIPVSSFSSFDELRPYFRSSNYGQQASLFASSAEKAAPLLDILVNQVSRVNLNARCQRGPDELPFTGRKDSAEGTLSVNDALKAFSIRSLAVANAAGRDLFFEIISSRLSRFLQL